MGKLQGTALVLFGLVALAVPSAVAANGGAPDPGMPRFVITIVCTIYGEYLDDAVTGMELALGMNLDRYASDCDISTEYVEPAPLPAASVDIPPGALFPNCESANECFVPYTTVISAGTDVTWTNSDTVLHTVTGDEANPDGQFDGWILPEEEFTFTFDTPGTYPYHCSIHPWAKGVLVVEPRSAAPPVAEPDTTAKLNQTDPQLAYDAVDSNIALYMSNGTDAFGTINAMADDSNPPVIAFVIAQDTLVIVAHNDDPLYVGLPVGPLLVNATVPIDIMLGILNQYGDDGVWLSYPLPDYQGNIIGYGRGWFKTYDGYMFGAQYSLTEAQRAQSVVDEMIRVYNLNPDTAFDTINKFKSDSPNYPFVVDPTTTRVVAHGSNPDRVGRESTLLTNSTVPLGKFQGMREGDGVWTDYFFLNPQTSTETLKRSWVMMHDGYLFGSGYYP